MKGYCQTAIARELAQDEVGALNESTSRKPDHEVVAESRQEILGGKSLPGDSVDLIRETREIGDSKRGFNNEAIDRLVALRQEIFGGKPLPGNSADLIREAREERSRRTDNWR